MLCGETGRGGTSSRGTPHLGQTNMNASENQNGQDTNLFMLSYIAKLFHLIHTQAQSLDMLVECGVRVF